MSKKNELEKKRYDIMKEIEEKQALAAELTHEILDMDLALSSAKNTDPRKESLENSRHEKFNRQQNLHVEIQQLRVEKGKIEYSLKDLEA